MSSPLPDGLDGVSTDGSGSASKVFVNNERAFKASYYVNGIAIDLSVEAPGTAQEGVLTVNDKEYSWMRDLETRRATGSNPAHISFVAEELAALREVERLLAQQAHDTSDLLGPMGAAWSTVAWLAMAPVGYEIPETSVDLSLRSTGHITCLLKNRSLVARWDDATYWAATTYGNDLGAGDATLKKYVAGPTSINKRFQWRVDPDGSWRVIMKTDAGWKNAWKSAAHGTDCYPKLVNGTLGVYNSSNTRIKTIATASGANQVRLIDDGSLWLYNGSTKLLRVSPDFTGDADAKVSMRTLTSGASSQLTVLTASDWGTHPFSGRPNPQMGGCGTTGIFGTLDCLQHDVCSYLNGSTDGSGSTQCGDEYKSANEDLIFGVLLCIPW